MNHPRDIELIELAGGTLDVHQAKAISEHLDRCADCQRRWSDLQRNWGLLESYPQPPAPTQATGDLVTAMNHAIDHQPVLRFPAVWPHSVWQRAAAAIILVAAGAAGHLAGRGSGEMSVDVADSVDAATVAQVLGLDGHDVVWVDEMLDVFLEPASQTDASGKEVL